MEIERTCCKCEEEANCFCRMCKSHYCPDHYCFHLQVAHEDNSYTERLKDEENRRVRASNEAQQTQAETPDANVLLTNVQNLGTYSTEELSQLLDDYRAQARKIRNELERRELFASGVIPRKYFDADDYSARLQRVHERKRRSSVVSGKLSQSNYKSVQVLLDSIRRGIVSVEEIEKKLKLKHSG